MQIIKPARFFLMLNILIIATSGCSGLTKSSAPNASDPVQVTTAPPGAPVQVTTATPSSPPVSKQQGVAPVSLPEKHDDEASDANSSVLAAKKMAPSGGDSFNTDLYERPFNANSMDTYFPYIDIVDTQGFKDDTWGYATVTLSGTDANAHLPGKYGVELDLNRDGRGDWLILASNPPSTAWTTQGVQAWKDANGDVGGMKPTIADKNSAGDGYETLVFDQGKSSDNPDGAWVRISPDDNKTVNLAFKLSMLGSPKLYTMGAWAGMDAVNPAMFDLNDHMTHLQAGDPDPNMQLYPITGLSEIDNACRMAIGFEPTGKEPGLCLTIIIIKHRESDKPGQPGAPVIPPPSNPNGGRD